MAKGSAMGLWKGKKGSSVFYQIKNTNSLQKQGIRERNYEPSNPQSARQASQRMRMYPAQAVYGVLKDTIERSWQGVKYGQMTRQAYLKSALRSEFYPAVSKGDGVIVPGPYQIAKGSLGEVVANLENNGAANIAFYLSDSGSATSTVGNLSHALLDANPWLKEGDQITVVLCYTGDSAIVRFNWWVGSFYIDSASTTEIESLEPRFFPNDIDFLYNGKGLVFSPANDAFIYAAACVVSREGTTPMRSNATLAVNAAALPDYYSAAARAKAQNSYMKTLTVQSTDWPVDDGDSKIMISASVVGEGGRVIGGGKFERGAFVALSAVPAEGYEFQGWYPTEADAKSKQNRISSASILTFSAGDPSAFDGTTTFFAVFVLKA